MKACSFPSHCDWNWSSFLSSTEIHCGKNATLFSSVSEGGLSVLQSVSLSVWQYCISSRSLRSTINDVGFGSRWCVPWLLGLHSLILTSHYPGVWQICLCPCLRISLPSHYIHSYGLSFFCSDSLLNSQQCYRKTDCLFMLCPWL